MTTMTENPRLPGRATSRAVEALPPAQIDTALRDVLRELFAPAARLEELRRKELLSGKEVQELYGLASGTLRNWRGQGRGPKTTQINTLVRYRHQDILNFIAAHQVRTYDQQ